MPRLPAGIRVRHSKDGTARYEATAYNPVTKSKKSLGTFDTVQQARTAKSQFEVSSGSTRRGDMTVIGWAGVWMTDRRLSESTTSQYEHSLAAFVEDFGDRTLSSITPEAAVFWASKQQPAHMDVISNFFNRAVDRGFVETNPFNRLGRGHVPGRADIEALGSDDIEQLAQAAYLVFDSTYAPVMGALVIITAKTGLRFGEVAALRWSAVRDRTLVVDVQLNKAGKETLPKGEHIRKVELTPEALAALESFAPSRHHEYVFYSISGLPLTRGTLYSNWVRIRAAAGFYETVFHELRHHYGTWMYRNFRDAQLVADQMGHQDGGLLVLTLYAHLSSDAARQAVSQRIENDGDLTAIQRGGALSDRSRTASGNGSPPKGLEGPHHRPKSTGEPST